jgi:tetratricopeptide (TPR) repeat protein
MTQPTPAAPRPEDLTPSAPPGGELLAGQERLLPDTTAPAAPGCRGDAGAPAGARSRYLPLRPLGKGGLGEVFVALDEELNREVALKEIQEQHRGSGDSVARFLLEAEVTGRLEHPGVVPVYGLGRSADGRPYYAMRLIKGETLKDAIEGFHNADTPGRDAGERGLAFRELLRRFTDVCNAAAYAHSKGVLHRDLKPANVMLGPFGETLVIDWGLAKVLCRPTGDSTEGVSLLRGTQATPGGTGLAGTPGYLSPEQADGLTDDLTPASDVYGLGAVLYTLLTGRPPFQGGSAELLLSRQRRGDFPPPRQVTPSVPAALEAVCLKAMALRPEDRYASARDLAADVGRWLGDEPITAYREPLAARLRRWGRRHRALMSGLAALLVTLTAALGVGLALVNAEREKTRRALADKEVEAVKAREAADRAEKAEKERRAELGRAHAAAAGLAAQRGQWEDALGHYKQALALEPEDEVALRLGVLECYMARYEFRAFREELARLAARPGLGRHRGEVRLLQAVEATFSARQDADPTALAQQALGLDLPPAEEAYAQALVAPTVPKAVEQLQRAARLAPFHRRTHELLPGMLFLLGRLPEMREAVARLHLIAPHSTTVALWQGFIFVLDGDLEAAYRECERLRPSVGDDGVAVARVMLRTLHVMGRSELPWLSEEQRLAILGDILGAAPQIARMLQDSKGPGGGERWADFAMYRLPCFRPLADHPALKSSGNPAQIMALMQPKVMSEVAGRLVETCPNGAFLWAYSTWLRSAGRTAEAEDVLCRALHTPSPFPIHRAALFDLTDLQFERLVGAPPEIQPDLRERIRVNLRDLAGRGSYPQWVSNQLTIIARNVDEHALALAFSEAALRGAADRTDALWGRFNAESALGAWARAAATTNELLKETPKDPALLNQRAVTEFRQGDFRDATATTFEALKLDAKNRDALGNLTILEAQVRQRLAVYAVLAEKLRLRSALILAHQGRHAEAVKAVADEKPEGDTLVALACLYALASSAAAADEKLAPEERRKLSEDHAARAVEMLRRGLESGYFKDRRRADALSGESDLNALRGRDDFRRVSEAIQKNE